MISHKSMREAQVNSLFDFLDMFPTKKSFLAHCKEKGKNISKWLPLWEKRKKEKFWQETIQKGLTAQQVINQLQHELAILNVSAKGF